MGALAAASVTPGDGTAGALSAVQPRQGSGDGAVGSCEPWSIPSVGWQDGLAAAPVPVPCTCVTLAAVAFQSLLQTPSFFLPSGSLKGWHLGVTPPSVSDLCSAVSSSHSCSG